MSKDFILGKRVNELDSEFIEKRITGKVTANYSRGEIGTVHHEIIEPSSTSDTSSDNHHKVSLDFIEADLEFRKKALAGSISVQYVRGSRHRLQQLRSS